MSKTLHPYYLQQMGIETWLVRHPVAQTIKLMIVGEALDVNQLFSKMLNSIGLSSEDVCLKSSLSPDLPQEIKKNPPQLLLALGSAVQFLLHQPLHTLRGKIHDYNGIPLIVSYHPTELLQHPADKKYAYQDLLRVQQIFTQLA